MPTATLIDYSYQALILVAMLTLPAVVTAATVGLLMGFLQAVTQVNDQSIAQAAKLLATVVVLLITLRWMGHEMVSFAEQLFRNFPALVH
jgi:type III secretion HrpO family protein